jgi:hypothetical protein
MFQYDWENDFVDLNPIVEKCLTIVQANKTSSKYIPFELKETGSPCKKQFPAKIDTFDVDIFDISLIEIFLL